jgi:hypothetical protein
MTACLVRQLFRQKIGLEMDEDLFQMIFYPFLISGKSYPPGINPRISYGVYATVWQSLLRVCLWYEQHPRIDLVWRIRQFMSCEEEREEKLGQKVIQRGYDPRFWHQFGSPSGLSRAVVAKMWRDREDNLLEEIKPTRWPIDCPDRGGLIDEENLPVLYFTKFLELLKTASVKGYSTERKRYPLHFKPYKLTVADCELLSNVSSTPGRECSSSRIGYSKKIIRDHLFHIEKKVLPGYNLIPKIVCHGWSPTWMDYTEKKAILNSWDEFLITEKRFRVIEKQRIDDIRYHKLKNTS